MASLTTSEKKVCKCSKPAVIIENKIYYCGDCYCVMKGIKQVG